MRNIRLFVEFAAVVMPGAVLLLVLSLIFLPPDWLLTGLPGSALGLLAGLVFAFAAGHLLQGFSQLLLEKVWPRARLYAKADWAVRRFAGHAQDRFLTDEQLEQLEIQYPIKLGVPFPPATADANTIDSAIAHAEAYIYSAKAFEHLDDINADYRLNKGLFTAFVLITISTAAGLIARVPLGSGRWAAFAIPLSIVAAISFYARMDSCNRNYAQTLFLQFLATSPAAREGGGKENGAGGGGVGMPRGFGRGAGARGAAQQDDDAP